MVSENSEQTWHLGEFVRVSDVSNAPFCSCVDVVVCTNPGAFPRSRICVPKVESRIVSQDPSLLRFW